MIYIVEGIDRMGKSTFANKLSEWIGVPVYHDDATTVDLGNWMDSPNETDKMLKMLNILDLTDSPMIFDRFHLTDFTYGLIDRNYIYKDALTNLGKIEDRLLKMRQHVFIYYMFDSKGPARASAMDGRDLSLHYKTMDAAFLMSPIASTRIEFDDIDREVEKAARKFYSLDANMAVEPRLEDANKCQ